MYTYLSKSQYLNNQIVYEMLSEQEKLIQTNFCTSLHIDKIWHSPHLISFQSYMSFILRFLNEKRTCIFLFFSFLKSKYQHWLVLMVKIDCLIILGYTLYRQYFRHVRATRHLRDTQPIMPIKQQDGQLHCYTSQRFLCQVYDVKDEMTNYEMLLLCYITQEICSIYACILCQSVSYLPN